MVMVKKFGMTKKKKFVIQGNKYSRMAKILLILNIFALLIGFLLTKLVLIVQSALILAYF